MRVELIGRSMFFPSQAKKFGYKPHHDEVDWSGIDAIDDLIEQDEAWEHAFDSLPSDGDEMVEFAGRMCYQSWNRPNPDTATNEGYLANIIDHGHFSVMEHATATIAADGISRALTHELIRHRHLSPSELSQRFVNMQEARFVVPPLAREALRNSVDYDPTDEEIDQHWQIQGFYADVRTAYEELVSQLEDAFPNAKRKQIREAARSAMPNSTETMIVLTGNVRAWRDMLFKRYHKDADAEIREFAGAVLEILRGEFPNQFQDFPTAPFGTEEQN